MKGKRTGFVAGMFLSAITSATIIIINPMLSQRLIDEVIIPANTGPLIPILAVMLMVQVIRLALRYIMHNVFLEPASNTAMTVIRRDMYKMVQGQDFRFLGKFPTGNLMTRIWTGYATPCLGFLCLHV
jgi:ATP-binding cassette subfamily B protein